MKTIPGFAAAMCLLLIAGCDSGTPEKGKAADKKPVRYTAPPTIPNPVDATAPVEAIKRAEPSKGAGQNSSTPQVAQVSTTTAPTINPAQEEATKAEVGVGKKGQYGDNNYLEVVVAAKFRAEERIIFEIEIPHALDLYKAGHNNKGPKTHEEFWKEIIEPANIQNKLPELREGERYQYDPKTEELMIVRPKRGGK